MDEVLRHRGPDGTGQYTDPRFSMGMRRLSIIDLEGGSQPIANEDGSLRVCFNGEIYNYVELQQELEAKGHVFKTRCDTEVIVHAYEQWGLDCLQRFNGMFAFALYDARAGEVVLARDRAGQKPLYWHRSGGRVFLGSEAKALLESEHVPREPNLAAIDPYLSLRYVPQPETLFAGIHVLPAGHFLRLRIEHGDLRIQRYWDVPLGETDTRSEAEIRDEFEELFIDAVRLTLRSDVPVGAYLSAGVDSSLTVAAMKRFHDEVKTFSIGFGSPIDETHDARRLADHLGCEHHEVIATPEDFQHLPHAIWHLERPIGDVLILAYYLLARATSQEVKVVLSGEGADESFAGYSFHKVIQWTRWATRLAPGFLMSDVAAGMVDALPVDLLDKGFIYPAHLGKEGRRKVADYLRHFQSRNLRESYVALRELFAEHDRDGLYTSAFRERIADDWITPPRDLGGSDLDVLLKLQFDDWLQDNLLLRQDKNTMAHSLELRCPFLDHRIIEMAFRMPGRMKIRGLTDKWVEREIGRKWLPPDNVKRSKNPFYFPLEYFHESSPIQDLISMTLDEEQVRKRGYFEPAAVKHLVSEMRGGEFIHLKQVMSLVILELWHMIFIDKQRMW
jgi:asparagine synthase (glutamine-hydrolysing)